jgi:SAM-dependent methyltransferase
LEYTTVTEGPGTRITREAAAMVLTRYAFAARFCVNCDVLEAACGPGIGLGYLARGARRVIGGDCTESFLRNAQRHYNGKMHLARMDAQALPFADDSFDVVVLFEAIYYLAEPGTFLQECRRVLREGGLLLISTVNPRWSGFNASPFSVRYFGAQDLQQLLENAQFDTELFTAFSVLAPTTKHRMLLRLRRLAVHLGLIPRTMKGKELLKRLTSGPLVPLANEITDDFAPTAPIIPLKGVEGDGGHKVLYAVARKNRDMSTRH